MTEQIKMIVLDMAGTTVVDNHEVEYCFAKAAEETNLNVTAERVLAIQGMAKRYVFELLWREQLGEGHPDLEKNIERSYVHFTEVLENHYRVNSIFPTEGCLELFALLKDAGIKIVLTTGFYRKVTNIILEKLGWLQGLNENYIGNEGSIIDMSIASDEVPNGRPAPDLIYKAMKTFGIEDEKSVICIGDTPSDLGIGRNANCLFSFGLVNGTHTRAQLERFENDGLFASLVEFKDFLSERLAKVENI